MDRSESIAALAAALAKAQGEMGAAKKESVNPHFRSKYADLAAVWEAARGPLSRNGLAIVQACEPSDSGVRLTTMLMHSSGEWISGAISVPVAKADAQGIGSALTYARRYALASTLGIAADEDDDGNAAVGRAVVGLQEPAGSQPGAAKARDWTAWSVDILRRLNAAATQEEITAIAKEVHQSKPPKKERDAIAEGYTRRIAAFSAESNGATAERQ